MNKKLHGTIFAILSAIIFGTMPIAANISSQYGSSPYMTSLARFFWGSIFLFLYLKLHPEQFVFPDIAKLKSILLISVFYAATPVLLYVSYTSIDTGIATTLHFTYPIAVVLLLFFFYKEHISIRQFFCMVLCFCGILFLFGAPGKSTFSGMLLAALSGVVYAFYIIFLKKMHLDSIPLGMLSFLFSCLGTIELFIVTLISGTFSVTLAPQAIGAQIYLGLFATAIAFTLFQKATFLCGPVQTSLLSTFEPLTGMFLGILFYNEAMTGNKIIGIAAILLSAVFLVLSQTRD